MRAPASPCRNCPPTPAVQRRRASTRIRDAAIAHLLRCGVTQREITWLSNRSVAVVTVNGGSHLRLNVARQDGAMRVEFIQLDREATRALMLHLDQTLALRDERSTVHLFTTGTRKPVDRREVSRIARWARKGNPR